MLDKEKVKEYCTEKFLVPFEGVGPMDVRGNFLAYLCPAKVPTIAWGLTFDDEGIPVKIGDVWPYDKAIRVKSNVLDSFLEDLLEASPSLEEESEARVAAILSWVYNLGITRYNTSTFKKKIDAKDWWDASVECKKWNKARVDGSLKELKGLVLRRDAEASAIITG